MDFESIEISEVAQAKLSHIASINVPIRRMSERGNPDFVHRDGLGEWQLVAFKRDKTIIVFGNPADSPGVGAFIWSNVEYEQIKDDVPRFFTQPIQVIDPENGEDIG